MNEILNNTQGMPIIFPIDSLAAKIFKDFGFGASILHIINPMAYLEFNYMVKNSKEVFISSSGITEETNIMRVPSIAHQDKAERLVTITRVTNKLIGINSENFRFEFRKLFNGDWKQNDNIKSWKIGSAGRKMKVLDNYII